MKNIIKKIWKKIMKPILRLYTSSPDLYIKNTFPVSDTEKYYSQFGQDIFALKNIFKNKNKGFFVDVGANDPVIGNNTYLLELNGWNGLAIEPQLSLREKWPSVRKTKCLNYVVGPENKEITFIEGDKDEHGLSGVEGFNKCSNKCNKISVQQKSLTDILSENSITNVDYLSIDVEGYELNVLKSIDFSKLNITLIDIENDIGFKNIPFIGKMLGSEFGDNKPRKFLEKKGYKYIARIFCDDFFIKKEKLENNNF
jgi:FkbM family methyltransferase